MRAVVQRVRSASVDVAGERIAEIGQGLLVLLGVHGDDTEAEARQIATKIAGLRIFSDDAGKMNLAAEDVNAEILLVSQFTLYGDVRKGRRPSFVGAAAPDHASPLVDFVAEEFRRAGIRVGTGIFGADMQVALVNDGPVTLWLDSAELRR